MSHNNSGTGEYTTLSSDIASYDKNTGYCSFENSYVHDVKDIKKDKADTLYTKGTNGNAVLVEFKLQDDTKISISECTKGTNPHNKKNGDYTDTLTIGDTKITFDTCSATKTPLIYASDAQQPFRGTGACYWCRLDEIHDQGSNKTYMRKTAGRDWAKESGYKDDPKIMESAIETIKSNDISSAAKNASGTFGG